MVQLSLLSVTAENPKGATRRRSRDRLGEIRAGAPKTNGKVGSASSATMEEVAYRLTDALLKVASNKGAPAPDGQTIEALAGQWSVVLPRLRADLLAGTYQPGGIRRVLIPKAGGGQRGLGIPDVIDRIVQEAVRQVLEPLWEPTFHPSNHGFRPGRSCHTAIAEAKTHVEDGYEWCVDLDLEKFFDLVCHQRLTARLAERVGDRRLLGLIGRMLKAKVVLPDGVQIASERGVPQGGPLSPLLSNVVLDELDRELDRRGHRFVRYADDAKVYVRSERAGQRVMSSLTEFIKGRLRLKVNEAKSAVARPEDRHFLGFRLRVDPHSGIVEVLLSERTMRNAMRKVKQLTPRNWGNTLPACISGIDAWLRGWHGFFGIVSASEMQMMRKIDAHLRRRLRAILLRHWKRKRTIARNLVKLGVKRESAWRQIYAGRKSWWALSHTHAGRSGPTQRVLRRARANLPG
jgi:group II intron reverse transcriptase/maturase